MRSARDDAVVGRKGTNYLLGKTYMPSTPDVENPPHLKRNSYRQTFCLTKPRLAILHFKYTIFMSQSTTLPPTTTKKILIIEDEGEMCLLLNIILDGNKMELDHVQDLKHATEYLKRSEPALVILDNKLPDGFGVDFIKHIKSNYPNIRIIMISGFGASAKDVAMENGADLFIEKPFTRTQLSQSIESLVN